MPKQKVYLDTSVISYLDQTDAPEKMRITQAVWEHFKKKKYDIYLSNVVFDELNGCSKEKLEILIEYLSQIEYIIVDVNDEAIELANKIVDMGILRQKSIDDSRHIAAAIVSNCDYVISWNFKHIVNISTIKGIKVLTTLEGYKDLLIYSPEVLVESED